MDRIEDYDYMPLSVAIIIFTFKSRRSKLRKGTILVNQYSRQDNPVMQPQ